MTTIHRAGATPCEVGIRRGIPYEPLKTAAWDLARGKQVSLSFCPWVTFREQTP